MRRLAAILLASSFLFGCQSLIDSAQKTAQAKLQHFLVNQFSQRLLGGIDSVIAQLSAKGGFLDDPLVRILLPPPLGLVIGVAHDLQENPKATLLQILINQAAENVIPVAGPILKNIVTNMDAQSLEKVLSGDSAAATEYLKERGGAAVKEALMPAITRELHANGAIELYGELLDARQKADEAAAAATDVQQQMEAAQETIEAVQNVSQEQLAQYVAEQATAGLFRKFAGEELSVRKELERLY